MGGFMREAFNLPDFLATLPLTTFTGVIEQNVILWKLSVERFVHISEIKRELSGRKLELTDSKLIQVLENLHQGGLVARVSEEQAYTITDLGSHLVTGASFPELVTKEIPKPGSSTLERILLLFLDQKRFFREEDIWNDLDSLRFRRESIVTALSTLLECGHAHYFSEETAKTFAQFGYTLSDKGLGQIIPKISEGFRIKREVEFWLSDFKENFEKFHKGFYSFAIIRSYQYFEDLLSLFDLDDNDFHGITIEKNSDNITRAFLTAVGSNQKKEYSDFGEYCFSLTVILFLNVIATQMSKIALFQDKKQITVNIILDSNVLISAINESDMWHSTTMAIIERLKSIAYKDLSRFKLRYFITNRTLAEIDSVLKTHISYFQDGKLGSIKTAKNIDKFIQSRSFAHDLLDKCVEHGMIPSSYESFINNKILSFNQTWEIQLVEEYLNSDEPFIKFDDLEGDVAKLVNEEIRKIDDLPLKSFVRLFRTKSKSIIPLNLGKEKHIKEIINDSSVPSSTKTIINTILNEYRQRLINLMQHKAYLLRVCNEDLEKGQKSEDVTSINLIWTYHRGLREYEEQLTEANEIRHTVFGKHFPVVITMLQDVKDTVASLGESILSAEVRFFYVFAKDKEDNYRELLRLLRQFEEIFESVLLPHQVDLGKINYAKQKLSKLLDDKLQEELKTTIEMLTQEVGIYGTESLND